MIEHKNRTFKNNKGEAENLNFDPIHPDGSFDVGGLSLAFYSGLFAYGGWNYLNFVIDELQDPYRFVTSTRSIHFDKKLSNRLHLGFRNLPVAITIAMPIVTLFCISFQM